MALENLTPTKFGMFTMPLHDPRGRNPTETLEADLKLIELLDDLGYDEVWVGEHHSGGWEYIGAPDIFIATAAQRTRNIRLGTGVTSITYHHPLTVADRMCLLDHLTRGRIMLGMGPGSLPHDAWMFGIDPRTQRPRLHEGADAIMALLRGEFVTRETDWFKLKDAHLQLMPYSDPCFEVAVAGAVSPTGARLAGRHGLSLLTVSATSSATFDALAAHWDVWQTEAAYYNQVADRRSWRMTGPVHIAETEAQARRDVEHGIGRWAEYFEKISTIAFFDTSGSISDIVESLIASNFAVIGTPDQAVQQIRRLAERSGGFGTWLIMDNDWAEPDAKRRSYELFAREVIPQFSTNMASLTRSESFAIELTPQVVALSKEARLNAAADYEAEKASRSAETASPSHA
jgi:limonene 1,2-monooxygenase